MFLRRHRKHAAGETYEYWTLCESRRTAAGPRQQVVATLGKLTGEELREEAGWEQLESLLDGRPAVPRQLRLGESPQTALTGPRWEVVDVRGVRVERARDFGEAFLGLALWRRLGLHTLLAELIEPGEEEVPWPTVASVLAVARFCGQRSELGIAERWYAHSAMEDLLGVSWAKVNDDRLYRRGGGGDKGGRRAGEPASMCSRRTRTSFARISWNVTARGSACSSSSCSTM